MKSKYEMSVPLICKSCHSKDIYLSEDKRFAKCNQCQKEYSGGYDELVKANQPRIDAELKKLKGEVVKDAQKEMEKMLKDVLRDSKFIKFK